MSNWLISRCLSYCTVLEFFDYLAEFSAKGFVTVRPYITPSEYVDIIDSTVPVILLIIMEIILLAVLLGFFVLGYKIATKGKYRFENVLKRFAKTLLWLGVLGLISRLLTFVETLWFLDREFITFTALPISCCRDAFYLLLGLLLPAAIKWWNTSHKSSDENRRSISSKTIWKLPVGLLLALSIMLNVHLALDRMQIRLEYDLMNDQIVDAEAANDLLKNQLTDAQNEIAEHNETIEDLKRKLWDYQGKTMGIQNEKAELETILDFYYEYFALVVRGDSKLYHTYQCKTFQDAYSFWAYTVDSAEERGYLPCAKYH